MRNKMITLSFVLALIVSFLSACGSTSPASEQSKSPEAASPSPQALEVKVDTTPVKLTIAPGWNITDEDFQQIFVMPVKEKYPHITLEKRTVSQTPQKLSEEMAGGNFPDILITGNEGFPTLLELKLVQDLKPLINKYRFDMNRFDANVQKLISSLGSKGEIYGLPYGVNYNALYFNKELFDKFGVPYPVDGMTWDQTIELGRKMTRNEGGVQYRGLESSNVARMASPRSLNFFDPATGKANLNTDEWKKAYQIFQSIITIPGNEPNTKVGDFYTDFEVGKTVAMLPTLGLFHRMPNNEKAGLNWDIVTYPVYPDKPGVYGETDAYFMVASPLSKFQDQIFQVMSIVLGDNAQLSSSKTGKLVTPLRSKQVKEAFGKESESLKNKNVQAIFKHTSANIHTNVSAYDKIARNRVISKSADIYKGIDINTIIRETEEMINKEVATLQGK